MKAARQLPAALGHLRSFRLFSFLAALRHKELHRVGPEIPVPGDAADPGVGWTWSAGRTPPSGFQTQKRMNPVRPGSPICERKERTPPGGWGRLCPPPPAPAAAPGGLDLWQEVTTSGGRAGGCGGDPVPGQPSVGSFPERSFAAVRSRRGNKALCRCRAPTPTPIPTPPRASQPRRPQPPPKGNAAEKLPELPGAWALEASVRPMASRPPSQRQDQGGRP